MPAPELNPQVPGESPKSDENATVTTENAELSALLAGDDTSVIAALPTLPTDALDMLGTIEASGENRESVLLAIADEIESRGIVPPPSIDPLLAINSGEPTMPPANVLTRAAPSTEPVRVDTQPRPVLTDEGWVVPEPLPNAQPQVR